MTSPPTSTSRIAERVLAGLDPEQREAAQAVRGPVCILAGAGTGKTRAITHRIAYMVHTDAAPAGHILAVTFTARAAGEMRTRLRLLGVGTVQARTFHSAALRQLQFFAPRILGGQLPEIVEHPIRLVANAAARSRLRADRSEVRDLAGEIDWAKAVLAGPAEYAGVAAVAGRQTNTTPDKIAEVYAEYEDSKRRSGQLDFADLLLIMAGALEEQADVAEQVRAQYRHFVVDEYQDVSPLQQRMLDAWLGGRDDLCVVGDPNQTIYSFAGATPTHLTGFARRYDGAHVVRLQRDYRSTPQVVELANAIVKNATDQGVKLLGQRADGPVPTFSEFDDETAEATTAAAGCARLIAAGTAPADIAILFRINAQSEVYEQALAEAGVPYVLRGGERFFDRPEIREARLLLRGAARAPARVSITATKERGAEPVDSSRVSIAATKEQEAEPVEDALPAAVREVLRSTGWNPASPPPGGAAREKWESLAALATLAEDTHTTMPAAGLSEFVAELEARAAIQHAPQVQGVTLASLHAAKGLEWDAVFLVGVTDSMLPISHATTDAQIAEERRLLYVGVTRARERLGLSWALSRAPGQRRTRKASRFLDGLRPGVEPGTSAAKKKSRSDAPTAADAELFARLRAWRKAQADAQGVPAFVVFSDATLVAIADRAPDTRAAMGNINGVGPTKLTRYADPVLEVLAGKPHRVVEVE